MYTKVHSNTKGADEAPWRERKQIPKGLPRVSHPTHSTSTKKPRSNTKFGLLAYNTSCDGALSLYQCSFRDNRQQKAQTLHNTMQHHDNEVRLHQDVQKSKLQSKTLSTNLQATRITQISNLCSPWLLCTIRVY